MDPDPDLPLVERWRGGDEAAFLELYRKHFADIARFFDRRVGARYDELTQETFTRCLAARATFRGASTFRTYLFGFAKKVLFDDARKNARKGSVDVDSLSDLVAEITSAGTRLDQERRAQRVREAVARLPASDQRLLEYRCRRGLGYEQLAQIFEAPEGTIRQRVRRAAAKVQAILESPAEKSLYEAFLENPDAVTKARPAALPGR